jgi:hypothetical protein
MRESEILSFICWEAAYRSACATQCCGTPLLHSSPTPTQSSPAAYWSRRTPPVDPFTSLMIRVAAAPISLESA